MIFWFSGNGNSRRVAQLLAEHLGDTLVSIADNRYSHSFSPARDEKIVWVFPVYGWSVPEIVRNFMLSVDLGAHTGSHSMVCTCGDDCGLTYEVWSSIIHRRGWLRRGGYSITMPNTYVSLPGFNVDPLPLMQSKLEKMPEAVALAARGIKSELRIDTTHHGSMAWVKTRVLNPPFEQLLMTARPFKSTEACISCGKCAATCPVKNITMKDGRPDWGSDCTQCLACYHSCPQHAVAWGKMTASKGQYRLP